MATIVQTVIGKLKATVEKLSSTVADIEYRSKVAATVQTTSKTALQIYVSGTKYLAQTGARTILQDTAYVGKTAVTYLLGKFVEIFYKAFGDSGQITDTTFRTTTKGLPDSISLQDSLNSAVGKTVQDVGQTQDVLSREVFYARQYQDNMGITDASAVGFAKPSEDVLSLSDSTAIVNIYNRNPQDTVLGTDDVNGAGADDDQNITFFKNTGEFSQVFDSISFQNTYSRQFSDEGSVTDQDSVETGKFFYDSGSLQDTLSIVTGFSRSPGDTSQVLDIQYIESTKPTEDSVGLVDNLSTSINYFREVNDSTTATDDVNGAATDDDQNITFFKNTGDLANFIDLTQFVSVFNRSFEDTTNLTDLLQVSSTKPVEDLSNLVDEISVEEGKGLFHNTLLTDDLTRILVVSRSLEDVGSVFDTTAYGFFKEVQDLGSVLDSVSFANSYSRAVSDLSNITDVGSLEVGKGSLDALQIVDTLSFTNIYLRSVSEQGALTDAVGLTFSKNIDDYINLQDITILAVDYGKITGDLVNVTDDVNGAGVDDDQNITFFKNLAPELLNITSTVSKGPEKGVPEALQITSQGTLLNQNYGADYFAQDYVGVSRSFT